MVKAPKAGATARSSSKPQPTPKGRLSEIVLLVRDTAKIKGWHAEVVAKDDTNFRHATVKVSRFLSANTVEGMLEIICDKQISIAYHNTSFYSWGLSDLLAAIKNELDKIAWIEKNPEKPPVEFANEILYRILRRFHLMAKQLRHRHADRPGIEIRDEYDVQDLLHAILRGLFDDIRAEEYTPSYAGGSSRIDFLLKSEKTAVELKMASSAIRDKQVGEQLLIDIGRYQSHPDCQKLICFVYDPGGNLKNPTGLEVDLSRTVGALKVKVIIVSI